MNLIKKIDFVIDFLENYESKIDYSLIIEYNLREIIKDKGMRTFNYSAIKNQKWDSEILELIAAIYKEYGKQDFYLKQRPNELEKLVDIAKIQSTEASNEIEGIVTTNTRIKQLVEKKTTPRNRNEQEIAGYRDVLFIILESYGAIPLSKNYILQLHKIMYSHMNNPMAGQTKNVQNYISTTFPDGHTEILFTPLSPFETPEALERICEEYNKVIGNMELEPLIAIAVFIHDFLCIHPFNDGNGRISRLLTTLLLYRCGFYVGKYISLEAKISKNKDLYYDALNRSQHGWHKGNEDVVPFIKYMLGTILAAYKDFDDRFAIVEEKRPAIDMVRKAIQNKIGRITKQDIREQCPSLSLSSIEGSLRKMVASGEIKREGAGKSTYYIRVKI
ncbi:Fic family protein [Floccifex sp.]|uniref:Fic family protein n=1 Tax=Floccifex sp. TaxID=2815810 RepID=UPI003EFBCF16